LVVRDKEDLDVWSRAFREGSSLSVKNHATMPLKQRKTPSTADDCARYDVVLTTFDALKSPDITHSVDDEGNVITATATNSSQWHSSRSSQSNRQECKQYSVLHRVSWQRVIMIDIIGRKSFLVKQDTARATAVKALSTHTRWAMFLTVDPDDESDPVKALVQSDKKSIPSLASVMRVQGGAPELKERVLNLMKLKNKSS
jgi:hypothetical protein